ncbi:TetR/AcrR family transcriptional regulator [Phytoactinopolyspora limicola]|uniref:TetR/AcrR family transcriptional regulator n=1 Tax=Phytoactinopolyspora limicola TaxID=2715536 RepID=UPI00140C8C87|nr:TetR/AcrR family transcriptional regulator [Phytoactinopolyspora limicola]
MDPHRSTSTPRTRRTRTERQLETRHALIGAALAAFTRDGYHGASLDDIANDAGYSKGAVYSNFGGKAELFLAVLDHNLEALRGDSWDPFEAVDSRATEPSGALPQSTREAAAYLHGFGLATLEFIATAARDDTLSQALRARVQVMVDAYRRVAVSGRRPDDPLPVDDVAQLMAALDQGVSILALSGAGSIDGPLMRAGLRRLLTGTTGDADEPPPAGADGASLLPDVERVRRLISDLPEAPPPHHTS